MFKFVGDSSIRYVDLLPELKRSVGHELYVPTAADMRPNKNGYRVIAEAISHFLGAKAVAN